MTDDAKNRHYAIWTTVCGIVLMLALIQNKPAAPDAPSWPPSSASQGGTVMIAPISGCSDINTWQRLMSMRANGDHTVGDNFQRRNDCISFKYKERVRVEETRVWAGAKCVARLGRDENCYWVMEEAVSN